jgi:DNA-binding MarR family transcriptional regulator
MITVHLTDASHAYIQSVLEDTIELCEGLSLDEPEEIEQNKEHIRKMKQALAELVS